MRRWILALPVCLLTLLACAPLAHADVTNFTFKSFDVDYTLDNSVAGGKLTTIESIDLIYTDYNHGILRAVPKTYHGWDTKLAVQSVTRDGQSEPYTIEGDKNGNEIIRVGKTDLTITGEHTYRLVYTQEHVVNFKSSVPEFYWDVNGTEWAQAFESVSATLHVKSSNLESASTRCFTGSNRSQGHDCTVEQQASDVRVQTTRRLSPGETLTLETPLSMVMFTQPTTGDLVQAHLGDIAGSIAGLLGVIVAFGLWLRYGRDYQGKSVIIPEYDAPEGLTPGEVGMLADYKVDGRDVSATLIDLAVRKYVRLHDDLKTILFVKTHTFTIERLNDDWSLLKDHEKALLEAIFEDGTTVQVNKLDKTAMRFAMQRIRKALKDSLVKQYGLIEASGLKLMIGMTLAGSFLFFGGFYLFGISPGLGLGALLAGAAFFLFGLLMPRRSHAGEEMNDKIKGLKLYMKVAEADRMKMLESVGRPYAAPAKTVDLFSKLLPYAVALGVEKSWAKQFYGVLTNPPDWYAGNYAAFNAGYFASSLTTVTSSFSHSFEASSGASGGAGGGGGGGGGGGW